MTVSVICLKKFLASSSSRLPLIRDEIEKVLAVRGFFQHVDEAVGLLEKVEQLDDSTDGLNVLEELELQRHSPAVDAGPLQHLVPGHVLDGHLPVVPGPDPGVHCAPM